MFKNLLNNVVFKNFSYLTIGTVVAQLISLVTILKITALLSPNDYGLFTFLSAQGMLLIKIGDLGNRNIVIRTIARVPAKTNDLLINGALMRTFAIVTLFTLYVVYNFFFGSLSVKELSLIFVFSLITCFANLFELVFMGNQKMLPTSIINLVHSLIWFVIVFFLLDVTFDVSNIFILYIGTSLVKAILFYWFLKKYRLLNGKVQKFMVSSKQLVAESWPYFAIILILLPLTSLSNNFLDINSTKSEIAYFNLAQKLIGPISLVITMLLTAIFPNLSALWTKEKDKFYHYLSIGFGFYIIVSMTGCFLFTVFSKEVVTYLFSEEYLPAIEVCQMQVWYLFLTSVDSFIGVVLGAANKEKLILRFSILYFLLCTPTLFYGSTFGALGLAYGYVLSYGIGMIYVWFTFKKTLKLKIRHERFVWLLGAALFTISYFISTETQLPYKILICVLILGGLVPYMYKLYKPLLAK